MRLILGSILIAATAALAAPVAACPPGLAKKNPPCVPPGLAKKGIKTGDRLASDGYYRRDAGRIYDPRRYRLPPIGENQGYYRNGAVVYRVDEQTRRILEWIELTDEILSN